MQRKKKPNGLLITGLISALASLAIVAVAPSFAGNTDNTRGNDRKAGYEENSKTPHEPNQGKGSDKDGDADGDPNTAYTEDNDTNDGDTPNNVADGGDNAHPSGKDRSVENGGSGIQGQSESNPDDSKGPMRYEGVQGDDKPNGPGGTDLADQDGNNGCGNDDDFNDDNNGWCGKPAAKPADTNKPTCPDGSTMPASGKCEGPKPCDADATMPGNQSCEKPDEVDADITCPAGTTMDADGNCMAILPSTPEPDDDVLGEQIDRDKATPQGPKVLGLRLSPALNSPVKVAGAVLPFTGGDLLLYLVLALALFASGMLVLRATRTNTNQS